MTVTNIERFTTAAGWSVTAEWGSPDPADEAAHLPRRVTVRDDGGARSWRGLPPPLVALPATPPPGLGVSIDVVWDVTESCFGPFTWVQSFRCGVEVSSPDDAAALTVRLGLTYTQLLRLLYRQEPFERVLGDDFTATHFSLCACVSGLVLAEDTPRAGAFASGELDALLAWAEPPAAVDHPSTHQHPSTQRGGANHEHDPS